MFVTMRCASKGRKWVVEINELGVIVRVVGVVGGWWWLLVGYVGKMQYRGMQWL